MQGLVVSWLPSWEPLNKGVYSGSQQNSLSQPQAMRHGSAAAVPPPPPWERCSGAVSWLMCASWQAQS
eukprot:363609-Chlamydomonas_euryale.AAC.10